MAHASLAAPRLPVERPTPERPALERPAVDLEVVVPAYNEERRLPETLDALERALAALPLTAAIVVVDNGSVDGTADVVRARQSARQSPRQGGREPARVPVHLLGCSRQGKGAAVRRGVLSSQARWVGFCDADLATSLAALSVTVAALEAGAPVVVGSRRLPQAQLVVQHGVARRLGGLGFRALVRALVPGVSDTQCGFKFFSGPVARSVFAACRSDGFAFDVEVLARAVRAGHAVHEVPVDWRAQDGSTFRVVQDGHSALRELLRIRRLLAAAEVGRELVHERRHPDGATGAGPAGALDPYADDVRPALRSAR